MKIPFKDKFADAAIVVARPIVNLLMAREITVVPTGDIISKEHDQFIMISNHFSTWDAFVVMKTIRSKIRFLATAIGFLDPSKGFGMKFLARAIPKRVGKPDYMAIRAIYDYLEMGYSIGFFPEGDNTFYGETLPIFKSTGKLLKKAGVDVILVKQQGGYLSQPRWADYFSTNGQVHTETLTLLTKEELKELSPSKINEIIEIAIYNNDYDFQRQKMIKFERKARAEGIERLVYYCDNCGGVLTVFGKGDDIVKLPVTELSVLADYFVLCTANSDPHLRAISERVKREVSKKFGKKPKLDGVAASSWIVMDYGQVVVHILSPEMRERLINSGLSRAKQFSWEKCAKMTHEVYEKCLKI